MIILRPQRHENQPNEHPQGPAESLGYEATDWEEIAPGVATLSLKQIMAATGHAVSFSSQIKRGNFRPHPRHWKALREVVESVGR